MSVEKISRIWQRRIRSLLFASLCGWCCFALVSDLQERRRTLQKIDQDRWVHPSRVTLGTRPLAEMEALAEAAAAAMPEGSVVGVLVDPKSPRPRNRQIAMIFAYLMPRHHVKRLRENPRVEEYWLTVRHRLRRQDLELVLELPSGALYRVPR